MSNRPDKDELRRSEFPIWELLQKAGARGKPRRMNCPFHDDRKPSAGIYRDDKGIYRFKCMVCDMIASDYYDVYEKMTGKSFSEQLSGEQKLVQFAVSRVESTQGSESQSKPQWRAFNSLDEAVEFFVSVKDANRVDGEHERELVSVEEYRPGRGEEPDFAVLRFEYHTDSGERLKEFRQCHLAEDGMWYLKSPKVTPLFGRSIAKASDMIVVVEGEKCAKALNKFGVPAVTSPGGANAAAKCDWTPLAGKTVVIWPDNDKSGEHYAKSVADILLRLEPACRVSILDISPLGLEKHQDCVDYLEANPSLTRDQLLALVRGGKVVKPLDALDEFHAKVYDGYYRRVDTPWPMFNFLACPNQPHDVAFISGFEGAGKSFFINQLVLHFIGKDVPVANLQLEKNKEFHLDRLLCQLAGSNKWSDSHHVEANHVFHRKLKEKYRTTLEKFERSLYDTSGVDRSYLGIVDWMEKQCKAGCRVLFVDSLTRVEFKNVFQDQSKFIDLVTERIAKKYRATLYFVVHIDGKTGMMRGSQILPQLADNVYTLSKVDMDNPKMQERATVWSPDEKRRFPVDKPYNRVVTLDKIRNGPGGGARIAYFFNPETFMYEEVGQISNAGVKVAVVDKGSKKGV